MKKCAAFLMACVLCLGLFGGMTAVADSEKPVFNEKDIVLRFPAISDMHIAGGLQSDKFLSALDQLKERGPLDAILIGGDFTDYGLPEQVKTFCSLLTSKVDLDKTRLVLAMGNHEMFDHELNKVPFMVNTYLKKELGDRYQHGAPNSDTMACRYHTQVSGFDLVAISCLSFEHGGVKYRQEDVDWLDDILTKSDPNKPVFITTHAMLEGTEWGSDLGGYWAEENKGKLREMLNKHPNAILFSGHLHYPLNNELSIWQGEFTGVGTASVYFASMGDKDPNGIPYLFMKGNEPSDRMNFSQGLLVEVDRAGNSRLTRMDFHNKKTIGEPWVIPAPKADKSHLRPYSIEERTKGNQVPAFSAGSKVKVRNVKDPMDLLEVSFPKAKDDNMVISYEVTFINQKTGKEINKVALYSDYYRSTYGQQSDVVFRVDDRMLYPFSTLYPDDYTCVVRAYDCYGAYSEPISSDTVKGTGIHEDISVGEKIHKDWQFKTYCNFNKYPDGYQILQNTDYNSWPSPTMKNAAKHPVFGDQGWQGSHGLRTEFTCDDGYMTVMFTNAARGYQADFEGAKEFWAWMDCSDVKFNSCYFGFRTGSAYGDQYTTKEQGDPVIKAWLLPEGETQWKEVVFNKDGAKALSGFKGFIRFAVDSFTFNYSLYPVDLQGFVFGFQQAPGQTGKQFVIDQVGFAGPTIQNADGTVEMLMNGEQFDKKQPLPKPEVSSEQPSEQESGRNSIPLWLWIALPVLFCAAGAAVAVWFARKKNRKQ